MFPTLFTYRIFVSNVTPPVGSMLKEYPFFTFELFPPGFLVHLGGVVSARSVKLLDRIHNPGEFLLDDCEDNVVNEK